MLGLAAFVVSVGVVTWLVTGRGRAGPPPATASSIARTSPPPFGALPDVGILSGVTCVSALDCWADGFNGSSILMLHYAGVSWAIVSTPSPAQSSAGLNGVTCVSAGDCWAVGNAGPIEVNSDTHSLIEHYTGSRWQIVAAPDPSLGPNVVLNAVACASAGECWAVGDSGNGKVTRPLLEHYIGGRWALVGASNPNSDPFAVLNGVACTTGGECWAVGYTGNAGVTRPLIEHYTGTRWIIVDAPDPIAAPLVALNGVTCVSRDCWAVGSSGIGNPTLLEHITGSTWTINANSGQGVSLGVSCTNAADCWAVGDTQQPSIAQGQPLIAHYNGINLIADNTPNPVESAGGETTAVLNGVFCVSAGDCWAVGSTDASGGTLIEQYTGSHWRVITAVGQGS
jgi:hypothetical protein